MRKAVEMVNCDSNSLHLEIDGEWDVGIDMTRCSGNVFPNLLVNVRSPTRAVKPTRNQPCPCGAGKKFKHCHGAI